MSLGDVAVSSAGRNGQEPPDIVKSTLEKVGAWDTMLWIAIPSALLRSDRGCLSRILDQNFSIADILVFFRTLFLHLPNDMI
jgi:hypothetical protein